MNHKSKLLHDLIHAPELLVMPGAYDALSAKLIEQAGFSACQISGFGVAASRFGLPDIGILSLRDQVNLTEWITQAVNIPVMADGDTGYGNAVNVYYTVLQLEHVGAAGVNLEDQIYPKRCGHMNGKQIIPQEEMIKKIKAANKAKKDPYFVINARTDAIAVYGVEEAVIRGNAYAKAGATLIFVEAPRTREEIEYVIKNIDAPVSINMLGTSGGKTPILTLKELEDMGVARVSLPIVTICSAAKQIQDSLNFLKTHGSLSGYEKKLMSFDEITQVVGLPFTQKLEEEISA